MLICFDRMNDTEARGGMAINRRMGAIHYRLSIPRTVSP